MSFHSDEVWESFDALWQRVQVLNRQVRELEARLLVLEASRASRPEDDFQPIVITSDDVN